LPSPLLEKFALDPTIRFLNHGSFGACPRAVLDVQTAWRARMEAEPVRFFVRELEALLDEARAALAAFLGADPEGLVFVPNATAGVNAIVRSLSFAPGDELLTTDHAYNACRNALEYVAGCAGARVVVARVPFPGTTPEAATAAVLEAVTPRTKLALLDHITSPTGLVMPIAAMIEALAARGVDTLVDGAHAPGMVALDVRALGAAYFTGNCHKWLCAPKGAGFLYVRRDRREGLVPAVVSHGWNAGRRDRPRLHLLFDWVGTSDPTPFLCVPDAIRVIGGLRPGGWPEVMAENRRLALAGRDRLCAALGVAPPAPDDMIGALAAVPLPPSPPDTPPPVSALYADPLQDRLFAGGIEVPIVPWPAPPARLVRISAQLYNSIDDYDALASALLTCLGQ
jgi:isopenicillin-N epimerase